MNYNLLALRNVTGDTTDLRHAQTFELQFSNGETLTVPRPVMQGLATFAQACFGRQTQHAELHYNGRIFTVGKPCDFDVLMTLQPLYKWALDAGMDYMQKVSSRDYSKNEHFFRHQVQRLPEVINGFKTVVTETAFDLNDMQMRLDIEHHYVNDTLLDECNGAARVLPDTVVRMPVRGRSIEVQTLPPIRIMRRAGQEM